jgi:hypothetical protein
MLTSLRFAPVGYQQITVTTLATLTVPPGATCAVITAEAQAVRYRDDGVAPTSGAGGVGMPLAVGVPLEYGGNLSALQFIAQVAGGIINVLYYRAAG